MSVTSSGVWGRRISTLGVRKSSRPGQGSERMQAAAGGGFEEADGGRPAGGDHAVAGEVEGEARGGVEGGVLAGGEVGDAADVFLKDGGGWVLRAGD